MQILVCTVGISLIFKAIKIAICCIHIVCSYIFLRSIANRTFSFAAIIPNNNLVDSLRNTSRKGLISCDSKPCFPFVTCVNVAQAPGFQCGVCPPGLKGDGVNCTDIDEVGLLLFYLFI